MEKQNSSSPKLTKDFVGYGHYKLTITYPDYVKAVITGDMDLIDRINSDVEKERTEAIAEAIALVQEQSL